MSKAREFVKELIKKELGYAFTEDFLSPEARAQIGRVEKKAEEYLNIEQIMLKKPINPLADLIRWIAGAIAFLIVGLFLASIEEFTFIAFIFIIGAPLLFFSSIFMYKGEKKMLSKRNALLDDINKDVTNIVSIIHEEMKEEYQRLREPKVEYKIVANVELKDGALLLRCPYCGASMKLVEKSKEVKCPYCGQTYMIPKKILDIL